MAVPAFPPLSCAFFVPGPATGLVPKRKRRCCVWGTPAAVCMMGVARSVPPVLARRTSLQARVGQAAYLI